MVNFVEISTWLRHAGSWFQKTEDLDPQVSLGAEKNKFAFQGVLGGTVKTQGGGGLNIAVVFFEQKLEFWKVHLGNIQIAEQKSHGPVWFRCFQKLDDS